MNFCSVQNTGEFEPGHDVHGHKLLEEKFAGVGDLDLGDISGTAAEVAPGRVGQQPAVATHLYLCLVAGDHQSLQEKETGTVANQTVAFHFTWT